MIFGLKTLASGESFSIPLCQILEGGRNCLDCLPDTGTPDFNDNNGLVALMDLWTRMQKVSY